MGERARQVFDQQAGATGRCVEALRELCSPRTIHGAPRMSKTPSPRAACCSRWFRSTGWRSPLRELRLRTGLEPVRRLRFPVVSIGNLSTGGAGKTPLTIALAKALDAPRPARGRALPRLRPPEPARRPR